MALGQILTPTELLQGVGPGKPVKAARLHQQIQQQIAALECIRARQSGFPDREMPQRQPPRCTNPCGGGIPVHVVLPLPLLLGQGLHRCVADRQGELDAGLAPAKVHPCHGQGLAPCQWVMRHQIGSASLAQPVTARLAGTLQRQPVGERRQDQPGGVMLGLLPGRIELQCCQLAAQLLAELSQRGQPSLPFQGFEPGEQVAAAVA